MENKAPKKHNEHVNDMLAYIENRPSLNMRAMAKEVEINYNQFIGVIKRRVNMPVWHEENLDKVLRLYGYNDTWNETSDTNTDIAEEAQTA